MKRLTVILLMIASLTACGGEKEEKLWSQGEKAQESFEEVAAEGELEQEDSPNEKSNVVPLEVLLADQYLEEWSETESGEWDETYTKLCTVTWQELVLSAECAREYPQLSKALQEKNKEFEQYSNDSMEYLLPLAQDAYDDEKEFDSSSFYPFSGDSKLSVQRGDNLIVSVREDFYEYSGGVHSIYGIIGMNYDSATGDVLLITDVLTDISSLPTLLSEKIIAVYGDEYESYESLQGYLEEEYGPEDYNWTMSYQGITFYFNPYEIASYAEGIIQTTLWFDEIQELIKAEYTDVPKGGYAMTLPLGYDIDVDLDPLDGKRDSILVSSFYQTEEDQEYGSLTLRIAKNDTYCEGPGYGYEFISYLVCTQEQDKERYYLYVESIQENDYSILRVYDLNQEEIRWEELSGVGFSGDWDENTGKYGTYYNHVLNNPQSFELVTKIEILGTWQGKRLYAADTENGIPQACKEDYLISSGDHSTVSLIPLEVSMLPDMELEELPAGTNFNFLRTDGESYVDAQLEDGRECRIYVEFEGGQQSVNGVEQWECFEELWYAG